MTLALAQRPPAGERAEEEFLAPGGQRKPLKRLDSDKGIQGNPSLFSLILFARDWPGLAGFC
jgi:hypothetical protein